MPTNPFETAYSEGFHHFQRREFQQALQAFSKAIALKRDDTCSWEMFAGCLGNLGRYEESLSAFVKVQQLGHECPNCCYNRSIALCALRRPEEALQAIDRSLALKADQPFAWFDRGMILGMSYASPDQIPMEPFDGRHEQAVEAFDRTIALMPELYEAWYYKGYVLYKLSHSGMAWQRAVAATGTAPDFLAESLSCLDRAMHLQPKRPEARQLRDQILSEGEEN